MKNMERRHSQSRLPVIFGREAIVSLNSPHNHFEDSIHTSKYLFLFVIIQYKSSESAVYIVFTFAIRPF